MVLYMSATVSVAQPMCARRITSSLQRAWSDLDMFEYYLRIFVFYLRIPACAIFN